MKTKKVDKRDPDVTKSGRCVVCGKERPELSVRDNDPFCSAKCCREWYNQEA